jgi:hypothetical protein
MPKFSATYQPENKGRPKGSKNKRSRISEDMIFTALDKLQQAVEQGEQWAIEAVLKRTHPTLKAVTPENSLDAEFLKLKMKEISELEQRLTALEQTHDNS